MPSTYLDVCFTLYILLIAFFSFSKIFLNANTLNRGGSRIKVAVEYIHTYIQLHVFEHSEELDIFLRNTLCAL